MAFDPNIYGGGASSTPATQKAVSPYGDLSPSAKSTAKKPAAKKPTGSPTWTYHGTNSATVPKKKATGGQVVRGGRASQFGAVTAKQAAKDQEDLSKTTVSLVQTGLKALLTSSAFSAGTVSQAITKAQKGDFLGILGAYTGGVANAKNLWEDKPVVSGTEIVKQLGLEQKAKNLGKAGKQFARGGRASQFGPITAQEAANASAGLANTALALGVDIVTDPLTYADGIGVIARGAKAATVGTKVGIKAAKLATKGAVPLKVAAKRIGAEEAAKLPAKSLTTDALGGYTKKAAVTPSMLAASEASTKGTEQLAKLNKKLTGKLNYEVVNLPAGSEAAKKYEVLTSSLSAFGKAAGSVLEAKKTSKLIEKFAKQAKAGDYGKDYIHSTTEAPKPSAVAEQVTPTNPNVFAGQKAVADTAPILRNIAETTTPTDIKVIKSVLNKVNKIAKTTEGTTRGSERILTNVRGLISQLHSPENQFLRNLEPSIRTNIDAAVKGDGTNPFTLIDNFSKSQTKPRQILAESLLKSRVGLTDGSGYSTIGEVMTKHGGNFSALTKADPQMAMQVANQLKGLLVRADAKASSADALKRITSLVGEDAAKQLKTAGAFNVKQLPSKDVIDAVLAKIPAASGGQVTKYGSMQELISGLQSGHEIPMNKLEQIVKAIDPQNAVLKQAETAAAKDYTNMLRSVVMGNVNTIAAMEQRWNMMNAKTFFSATGIHAADGVAAYADARLMNKIPAMPEVLTKTRQAAAEHVAKLMDSNAADMADVFNSLSRGFESNFDYMREIMASPDYLEHVSSLNDIAIRSTEKAYMSDTKAALRLQTNQSLEAKVFGSIVAKKTWRVANAKGQKAAKDALTTAKEKMLYLSSQMQAADDVVYATLGSRFTHNKWVKQAAGKAENKHFVYLHIGDVSSVLYKSGENSQKAFIDSFFPFGEGIITKEGEVVDSFSTIALGSTVRQLLEARQTGAVLDLKDLVKTLKMKGETQKVWSKAFAKTAEQRAEALINEINKPAVLDQLEQIHNTRALADIESNMEIAHTMNSNVMDNLAEGLRILRDKNIDNNADRLTLLRESFAKLAYASDVLKQSRGDVAESMLKALSMIYLQGGKIRDITAKGEKYITGSDLVTKEEFVKIRDLMNTMFRHENPEAAAPMGREGLPFPKPEAKAAAQNKLTETMLAYEKHFADRLTLTTKAEVKTWLTKQRSLQKKLDAARETAWNNWIDTKHFDVATQTWVDSSQFDHAASTAAAQNMDRIILQDGTANLAGEVVDTVAKRPRKTTKAQQKQIWEQDEPVRQARGKKLADGAVQDAAKHTLDSAADIAKAAEGDINVAQLRTIQEFYDKPLNDSVIRVYTTYDRSRKATNLPGTINSGRLSQLANRLDANAGKADVAPYMAMAESNKQMMNSSLSHALDLMKKKYKGALEGDGFMTAFGHWAAQTMPDQAADPIMHDLVSNLNNALQPVRQAMTEEGFSTQALQNAFNHYGLGDKLGFADVKGMTQDQLKKYFETLPFAPKPAWVGDLTTIEGADWANRTQAFIDSGSDPFIILSRFGMAVQHAKTEKAMADSLVANFGHESFGLTAKQAVERGWVQVKAVNETKGINLTAHFPTGDNAAYFHPDIAPQIGALNREWNSIASGSPQWLKPVMGLMSLVKAQQTIFTPRHHVINIVGDNGIAIVYGTRNVEHWVAGAKVAKNIANEILKTEYLGNKLVEEIAMVAKNYDKSSKFLNSAEDMNKGFMSFNIGGKIQHISIEDLTQEFKARGITISNIFNDEIAGLTESVLSDASNATGAKKTLFQSINHAIFQANRLAKPAGDLSVFYGNVPRAAHAISVGAKRSWRSTDEMFAAMAKEIHLTHPTIQSLASGERKVMRPLFTYYTWLRVAHSAMIDMALNHGRWMTVYPQLQYETAKQNQMGNISAAVPWSKQQKEMLPDYLTKSAYGPSFNPADPTLVRPPILPLDVMENWNFTWDPTKSFEENMISVGQQEFMNVAKMGNVIGKTAYGLFANYNLDTNKPAGTDTPQGRNDYLYQLLPIVSQLGAGIGAYTPQKNAETGGNPLTPADRQQKFINFLTGMKMQRVNTPANLKIGAQQATERYNRQAMIDWLKAQNKGKK